MQGLHCPHRLFLQPFLSSRRKDGICTRGWTHRSRNLHTYLYSSFFYAAMCIAAEGQQGCAGRARGRQSSPGLLSSNCKATYPGAARPGDPVALQHKMWPCSSEAWFPARSKGRGSLSFSPRPMPARCIQEKPGTARGPRFPHRPLIHRLRGWRSSRVGARRRAKHHGRLLQLRRRNHLQACKHPGVAGKIVHPLAG